MRWLGSGPALGHVESADSSPAPYPFVKLVQAYPAEEPCTVAHQGHFTHHDFAVSLGCWALRIDLFRDFPRYRTAPKVNA